MCLSLIQSPSCQVSSIFSDDHISQYCWWRLYRDKDHVCPCQRLLQSHPALICRLLHLCKSISKNLVSKLGLSPICHLFVKLVGSSHKVQGRQLNDALVMSPICLSTRLMGLCTPRIRFGLLTYVSNLWIAAGTQAPGKLRTNLDFVLIVDRRGSKGLQKFVAFP